MMYLSNCSPAVLERLREDIVKSGSFVAFELGNGLCHVSHSGLWKGG